MSEVSQKKLFITLFILGLMGILSTLLMPLIIPEGFETELSDTTLRLVSIVQPAIMLLLAVWAGIGLGKNFGLKAPIIESVLLKNYSRSQLQPFKSSSIYGFIGGAFVILISASVVPYLPESFILAGEKAAATLNPIVRFMYGGITEELLMRWGLMSLIVWFGFKVTGSKSPAIFWTGIIIAAIIFGAGHLPAAYALTSDVNLLLILYIMISNSILGILFGWLFWKKGIESAMIAHIFAHVAFLSLAPLFS